MRELRMLVRTVVILMVTVLSGLALYFWIRSESTATAQFTRTQVTVARLGARRLEEIIHHFENALLKQTHPGAICDPSGDEEGREVAMLARLEHIGAQDVMRVSASGEVISSVAFSPAVLEPIWRSSRDHCSAGAAESICQASASQGTDLGLSGHVLVISTPLPDCTGQEGYLAIVANWERIGRLINAETALSPFALGWILDDEGTLLYHPGHPEMTMRSVRSNDGSCTECHLSFTVARAMLDGETGTDTIEVLGSERKLVAYAPVEVLGQSWFLAVSAPRSVVVSQTRSSLIIAILVSGLLIGLFLSVTYVLDRENRRYIEVLEQSRRTINELNADLEEKIAERTRELSNLYTEMRETQRRHDANQRLAIVGELSSIVAHEIRTPLNSLAISTQRILRGLKTGQEPDTEKVRSLVESQLFEVQRINDYIEEYLRFSRLPRRVATTTDINRTAKKLLGFFELEAKRSGVILQWDSDREKIWLEVDEEQLRQILMNLLVNAVQAMPRGGSIRVETRVSDEEVVLSVADDGPGIARDMIQEVFKPFFTTRDEGTGLGLAIAARLVAENGGSIECDSIEGEGTTFRVRFPVSR